MVAISTLMAVLGLASKAAGAYGAYEQNKKTERGLLAQKSDLDSEYYRGLLDSNSSRAYLRDLNDSLRENLQGIDNSAVSTGQTSEAKLAAVQKANDSMVKAESKLLDQQDDNRYRYFNLRNGIESDLGKHRAGYAKNWVDMAANIANSAGDLGEAYLNDDNTAQLFETSKPAEFTPDYSGLNKVDASTPLKTNVERTTQAPLPILSQETQDAVRKARLAAMGAQSMDNAIR